MEFKMVKNANEVYRIWRFNGVEWQPCGRPYNTKGIAIGVAKRKWFSRDYKNLKVVYYIAEEEYDII